MPHVVHLLKKRPFFAKGRRARTALARGVLPDRSKSRQLAGLWRCFAM